MFDKRSKSKTALWIAGIILTVALAYYISAEHYQFTLIQGSSMEPSYHEFQLVIIDKHIHPYSYGDVIVFDCDALDATLIKRVAAVPGDSVLIDENGTLYINGKISDVYPKTGYFEYAGIASETLILTDGHYFVIGDNTAYSKDSRYSEVGLVDISCILGEVCGNVPPLVS